MADSLQDLGRFYGLAFILHLSMFLLAVLQLLPSKAHYARTQELVNRVIVTLIAAVPIGGPTVAICANAACSYKLKKIGIAVLDPAKLKTAAAVSIVCFDMTGTLTGSVVSHVRYTASKLRWLIFHNRTAAK